jgi:hypothetical protein
VSDFAALIAQIEAAVDAHPELTRARRGGRGFEDAELRFSHGSWRAGCECRSKVARGRGSRILCSVYGDGETPELAVAKLIEMIPYWAEGMK